MKLSIGIVGLPNVGKSSLFKILTKNEVNIANYPFCTIDPNVGVVNVPDDRLNTLSTISNSKKILPAVVEFYDIAGLVKGASDGAGLGNKFLSHIREVDAIVMVIRVFKDKDIIHVEEGIDPIRDLEIINTELIIKDLETVNNRLSSIDKEIKAGKKESAEEKVILLQIREKLESGELITEWGSELSIKNLGLLSAKKQLYLLNGDEEDVSDELKNKIKSLNSDFVIINILLAEIDEEESKKSLEALIKKSYSVLDLISFLTTGEEETRAWTIKQGSNAPVAAGAIHTDFEKKFIRAEVVSFEDLVSSEGFVGAKQKGKLRLEGKDYIVKDGDVIVFRHG